jgi:hypothetical protein
VSPERREQACSGFDGIYTRQRRHAGNRRGEGRLQPERPDANSREEGTGTAGHDRLLRGKRPKATLQSSTLQPSRARRRAGDPRCL